MVGLNPNFREDYLRQGGDLRWITNHWNKIKSLVTVACGEYGFEEQVARKKVNPQTTRDTWQLEIALILIKQYRIRSLQITSNKRHIPAPCNKEMMKLESIDFGKMKNPKPKTPIFVPVKINDADKGDHIKYKGDLFQVTDVITLDGYRILEAYKRFDGLLTDDVSYVFTDGDNYHFSYSAKRDSLDKMLNDIRGKYIKKELT